MSSSYTCGSCSKRFGANVDLNKHILSGVHRQKHTCRSCSKRFGSSGALQKHISSGIHAPKYTCDGCDISYLSEHDLHHHVQTTAAHSHHCKKCDKTFRSEFVLEQHFCSAAACKKKDVHGLKGLGGFGSGSSGRRQSTVPAIGFGPSPPFGLQPTMTAWGAIPGVAIPPNPSSASFNFMATPPTTFSSVPFGFGTPFSALPYSGLESNTLFNSQPPSGFMSSNPSIAQSAALAMGYAPGTQGYDMRDTIIQTPYVNRY